MSLVFIRDSKTFCQCCFTTCCFCHMISNKDIIWAASSEFVPYRLCEQRRFRRACASAQSRQNLRCSLIQAVNQEEPSDRKPDPWPLWMAWHAQLKFVMTECSKTQIRLTRPILVLSGWALSLRSYWSILSSPWKKWLLTISDVCTVLRSEDILATKHDISQCHWN